MVLEVTTPDRQDRRRRSKSDDLDAQAAAHAAFAEQRPSHLEAGTAWWNLSEFERLAERRPVNARRIAPAIDPEYDHRCA